MVGILSTGRIKGTAKLLYGRFSGHETPPETLSGRKSPGFEVEKLCTFLVQACTITGFGRSISAVLVNNRKSRYPFLFEGLKDREGWNR